MTLPGELVDKINYIYNAMRAIDSANQAAGHMPIDACAPATETAPEQPQSAPKGEKKASPKKAAGASLEEAQKAMRALMDVQGREACVEELSKFGGGKLSDLTTEQYSELIDNVMTRIHGESK